MKVNAGIISPGGVRARPGGGDIAITPTRGTRNCAAGGGARLGRSCVGEGERGRKVLALGDRCGLTDPNSRRWPVRPVGAAVIAMAADLAGGLAAAVAGGDAV